MDKTGENKIVLRSSDNSMLINVKGNLTIEAGGKITIQGQELTLSGKQSAEMSSEVQVTSRPSR